MVQTAVRKADVVPVQLVTSSDSDSICSPTPRFLFRTWNDVATPDTATETNACTISGVSDAFRGVDVARVREGVRQLGTDQAATEEPLEIRLHNQPFAVIMRTPGADRELAAGFLLAEGVLKSADDLGTLEHCTDPGAEHP